MVQIDDIDGQILSALQENGRLTMRALAEQIGLSSPAMIERVRRLEERGVISGYRAIVNAEALGWSLTVYIAVQAPGEALPRFLEQIKQEPGIVECVRTSGRTPFLLKAHTDGTAGLSALLDRLSATGAFCDASIVLDAPVPWQSVTAVLGAQQPRGRRGRKPAAKN